MVSLGVDVGTTTTHHALWRLEPMGASWGPAEFLSESPILETPWKDDGSLDVSALVGWHRDLLAKSTVRFGLPKMGTALVTGEAARRPEARSALDALGTLCGGLVGSLAGGRIESLLAGRASGAEADARARLRRAACLDIGGGTANAAVFHPDGGHRLANLRLGGRMIRLGRAGEILRATAPAHHLAREAGLSLELGRILSEGDRKTLCRRAAAICLRALDGDAPAWAWDAPWDRPPGGWDLLYLCGGVGDCARHPPSDPLAWGDLGPELAQAFVEQVSSARLRFPEGQAIRTTVTGVASRLARLSGSTVWDGREGTALRGLPVMRLDLRQFPSQPFSLPDGNLGQAIAWCILLPDPLDWKLLRSIASFLGGLSVAHPLVVLVSDDHARALGQALRLEAPGRETLVLDRLVAEAGDFLDVGPALANGSVAVSLRSLNWQ